METEAEYHSEEVAKQWQKWLHEWPDDFFDFDAAVDTQSEPKDEEYHYQNAEQQGVMHILQLPIELLRLIVQPLGLQDRARATRCCRALHEAVATSKWVTGCLGGGMFTVKANERNSELFVRVDFGGKIVEHADDSINAFDSVHSLFDKLHLNELRLVNVPLDHDLLRSFNSFIDDCTFDTLSIIISSLRDPINQRMRQLIDRAKEKVYIMMKSSMLSEQELLSINRPVNLSLQNTSNTPAFLSKSLLMELVRRGHSLDRFRTKFDSVQAIREVIETISSSRAPQYIDIWSRDFKVCKRFVESVNAAQLTREYGTETDAYFGYLGNPVAMYVHSKDYPICFPA